MAVFKKNRVVFTLVLLILLFSISIPNVVALVKEKSLNDLTRDADNIITGKVLRQESYWEKGNIFTNVTILANKHIKGNSNNKVVIKIPGGTVGDIYAEVSDVALFDDNEEVLLFLKENSVVGWNQGKYSIRNNSIKETGEPLVEFVHNIEHNLGTQISTKNIGTGRDSVRSGNLTSQKSVTNVTLSIMRPHITDVTPSSGPAMAANLGSIVAASNSTQITISGLGFGSTNGSATFWHGGTVQYDATIVSWTDTKIVANVPGRISSYAKPGNDGNVQVFTRDGVPSDNYGNFGVTYSYGGGKWSGSKVTYMINPNTRNTINGLSAIQAAADTWSNVGANFGFVYGGLSSKTYVAMDGENSIIWVNYDTGSVATTTTWWLGTNTKSIVENDIVFNDLNISWGTDGSSTKMDLQTVATHEFGHWLQLLDLYGSTDSNKMMYGHVSEGEIKRTLDTSDIAGIKSIYGLGIGKSDILTYYRGLGKYPNVIETNDLLQAADNWRNDIIPSEYSGSITTGQLLILAEEWRDS